ncbi:MAG: MFS transporter [Ignavibacterium sp.]|nr:MAG: MFS transporter [Ignavibacterium sp.]
MKVEKFIKSKLPKNVNQVSLYPILAVNFVGTLGFSIVLPFLIFLVTRFGGNAVVYGIMGATYSAFQLVGAPILGRWSDIYGRRKILLLSQLGTLLSWFIFLAALYLPLDEFLKVDSALLGTFTLTLPLIILFIARALDGITGGNVSVANAYLADVTAEDKRNENFGKMAVSANLGFIIGPALAGLLGATQWGETLPVLAALLISVIATLIIILFLKDSKPSAIEKNPEGLNVRKVLGQEQKDCFKIDCKENHTFTDILKLKNIAYLLTIYFLVFLGFNFFYIAFPVHAVTALTWTLSDIGIFFAYIGFTMVIVQGPVLKRLSQKYSDTILATIGSFILAVSFLFFTSNVLWMLYIGGALLSLGNGLMWSSILSILSKASEEKYQGTIQGFAGSAGSLASIIGLIIGGLIYEQVGNEIFILSAIIIFIVFFMGFKVLSIKLNFVQNNSAS